MKQIERKNLSKNDYEEQKTHSEIVIKSSPKFQKEDKNINFEKEKIGEVVKLLSEEKINITPLKVKKFIFKELDAQAVSKRIVKAISQVQELKRKAEEDAKKIWVD